MVQRMEAALLESIARAEQVEHTRAYKALLAAWRTQSTEAEGAVVKRGDLKELFKECNEVNEFIHTGSVKNNGVRLPASQHADYERTAMMKLAAKT